jgi:hypothetical protein
MRVGELEVILARMRIQIVRLQMRISMLEAWSDAAASPSDPEDSVAVDEHNHDGARP